MWITIINNENQFICQVKSGLMMFTGYLGMIEILERLNNDYDWVFLNYNGMNIDKIDMIAYFDYLLKENTYVIGHA